MVDDPIQHAAAGAARTFLDELPHQGPVPNGPANERLRQFAILYLHEPNSQAVVIRMERGHAYGVRVCISLELAGI